MPTSLTLCSTQQRALDEVLSAARPGSLVSLVADAGNGKSMLLEVARERLGGTILGPIEFQNAIARHHPLAVEDAFYDLVSDALGKHEVVLVDDLHLLMQVLEGCHSYPRGGLINATLIALGTQARVTHRTVIVASAYANQFLYQYGTRVGMAEFDAVDYRTICSSYFTVEQIAALDFAKIFRFARRINARQLSRACEAVRPALARAGDLENATDVFIDYLRSAQLISNVNLGEVQAVVLEDLKGVDDVLRALEANVILPLEESELATELGLKPKRGVLLAGPPGTGKTTIGRALAHRLRGKFFLIDGTVIAGTPSFYPQLHAVFEAAMRNAPSVVFIDDSDVIFEGDDPGLYRYLLTMLDGLESESAGGVCLVLTAMDVGSLPAALVRSGRIELWLETRLPDTGARTAILTDLCRDLPSVMGNVDIERIAIATEELSGADLKRVVEDGKLLYAFDRARAVTVRPATEYFLESLETIKANKIRYAQAEASARTRNPSRPSYFAAGMGMMGAERVEFVDFVRTRG